MQIFLIKCQRALIKTLPMVTGFLAVLFSVASFDLPSSSAFAPFLFLMVVFYWGMMRPDLFSLLAVVLLAFLQDLFDVELFGTNILLATVVYAVAVYRRRLLLEQPFVMIWATFAATILAVVFVALALRTFVVKTDIDLWAALCKFLLTVLLYPFVVWALAKVQKSIPEDDL